MNKDVELVLTLLINGFNVDDVVSELNIDHKRMAEILKTIRDLGYNYIKSFSSDGTITLKTTRKLNLNPNEHVRVNVKESTFRTIFISDLHIGGALEQPKRIKTVSDYAEQHDIHTIFNAGDIINNYYPDQEPMAKIENPVDQAKRYLRYAPGTSKQIYFNLGGNHDYKSLAETGFDSLRYYEDRRVNQISLGYGLCFVHLKGDTIALAHEIKNINNNINSTMIFRGHSHKFRNRENKIINVPALTDNYRGAYEFIPIPGFLDAEFSFFDNLITKVNLKQITFADEDLRLASEQTIIVRPELETRLQMKLQKKKR